MAQSRPWAQILRVIGQEVSKFSPVFLEIETRGAAILVRGSSVVGARDSGPAGVRNVLKSWIKLLEANADKDAGQAGLKWFERRYTQEDIDKLDERWAKRRGTVNNNPDLYSFPELLRIVGRYIDSEGLRLLKVTKENLTLIVHFQDRDGNVKAQECSLMALYKKQQDMISKRGTSEIKDIWKHYDL